LFKGDEEERKVAADETQSSNGGDLFLRLMNNIVTDADGSVTMTQVVIHVRYMLKTYYFLILTLSEFLLHFIYKYFIFYFNYFFRFILMGYHVKLSKNSQ